MELKLEYVIDGMETYNKDSLFSTQVRDNVRKKGEWLVKKIALNSKDNIVIIEIKHPKKDIVKTLRLEKNGSQGQKLIFPRSL